MSSKKCFSSVVMTGKQVKKHRPRKKHDCCKDDCCKRGTCKCNFKKQELKETKLNSDCFVVNSLVGAKSVQKVAERFFELADLGIADLDDIISITVTPNLAGITQNARIIKDKVVNIGLVPATITISVVGVALPITLTTSIPFQAHTDFPGACPQDLLQESPLEVEGIFTQEVPGIEIGGVVTLAGILVKVVLRTTITVTRPVIKDAEGHFCDVDPNRCETLGTPPSFNFPAPPNGNGGTP
ncbi:hypothetical protein JNUCC74_03085 [Cerasibacillus sp. JNUCC 74]|jgi:hypothetical protein|uniref:hypothetical protein n=1 Tax=Virgibacillus proomii TaxID=84407 RepID=UPI0009842604|nr:hypothetical protein [Virgibacillus proomii]